MNRLKEAMMLLIANEAPLGPEWLDHPLKGRWDGHRECHIGGDFLLAYKLADGGAPGLRRFRPDRLSCRLVRGVNPVSRPTH
jgi:mRNA interferase YafQ